MRSAADLHAVDPDRAHLKSADLERVRDLVPAETVLSRERTLPVDKALASIVPSGSLQRGSTVAVHGTGATSFALAVVAQSVRDGSFLAIVAPESFGLAACLDFGIPLRRVVQFVLPELAKPGEAGVLVSPRDEARGAGVQRGQANAARAELAEPGDTWAQSVAAIVEGFDLVVIADQRQVRGSQARQLVARNRERGSVLVRVGGRSWPEAADLRFDVNSPEWSGLGQGYGYLQERRVTVKVAGRRYHGRSRSHELMLPAAAGGVTPASARVTPVLSERTSSSDTSNRYAGSDIDAMLDSTDQGETGGAVDLDATA